MVRIAPIRLTYNPSPLWFDAGDLTLNVNDLVIVETARGTEWGHVSQEIFDADEDQIAELKSPLKPVVRLATDGDVDLIEEREGQSREALPVFKELAAEDNDEMHPVAVEYLFDGDKAVFYFTAEERVDFRELVRKLAAHFHIRVDMRQIGVRDEARMVGGVGHCGQELCCCRLGGEFCPVSIRMAKEQDLSLNPQKISGVCGRLMCCLRYEYDLYKEVKKRAPKQNAVVSTPEGPAKVVEINVPHEIITLKNDEDKRVKVKISDFDEPEEGERPSVVGKEAWQLAIDRMSYGSEKIEFFNTDQLTQEDSLAKDPTEVHRLVPNSKRSESAHATKQEHAKHAERRRRSVKVATDGSKQVKNAEPSSEHKADDKSHETRKNNARPGQRSSGLRRRNRKSGANHEAATSPSRESSKRSNGKDRKNNAQGGAEPQAQPRRKSRRRSHKAHGEKA